MKLVHLFVIVSAFGVQPALAADDATTLGEGSQLVGLIDSVVNVIAGLIAWILPLAGGIAVIMVIVGGLQIVVGQKDVGKKTVIAALTGVVIIALSYVMVTFMQTFF